MKEGTLNLIAIAIFVAALITMALLTPREVLFEKPCICGDSWRIGMPGCWSNQVNGVSIWINCPKHTDSSVRQP